MTNLDALSKPNVTLYSVSTVAGVLMSWQLSSPSPFVKPNKFKENFVYKLPQ